MRLTETSNGVRITESGGKKYIYGVYGICEKINANSRLYPLPIMKEAVSELLPKLKEGKVLGNLSHIQTNSTNVVETAISHKVLSLKFEGNNLIGKSLVLPTAAGRDLISLMENGVRLGISTNSIGEVEDCGEYQKITSLKILSFDAVMNPSSEKMCELMENKQLKDIVEKRFNDKQNWFDDAIQATINQMALEAIREGGITEDSISKLAEDIMNEDFHKTFGKRKMWEDTAIQELSKPKEKR